MTTYYVGIGGSDVNDGTSWANRKLTLNGAEDIPVAASDTVYVGPGVYRELLTADVAGTSGNIITYIGDVTGENTDGVGGIVRVTGSDDDQTATRANCVLNSSMSFRTYRGFAFDYVTAAIFDTTSGDDIIIEDCSFENGQGGDDHGIKVNSSTAFRITVRRCSFLGCYSAVLLVAGATQQNADILVENCLFVGQGNDGVHIERLGGVTVKNCTFVCQQDDCVDVAIALDVGGTQTTVNNNLFLYAVGDALEATVTGEIVEDYNTFFANTSDRTNTATGANSLTYPAIFEPPILKDGIVMPHQSRWVLSEWSQLIRVAGSGEATEDFFGVLRPTTSAKNSWGAIQLREGERETTTTRTGDASIKLADAGDHQIFIPTSAVSTTFSVYVNRETNYAGTNPQMIIRQPGVADDTTTDAAAASQFNQLTTTLTPAADPPYVVMILRSLNTATSGSYAVYFDDMEVD